MMRERNNKGRLVKKDSEKVENKTKKGGKKKDNNKIIPRSKWPSWVNWVLVKK